MKDKTFYNNFLNSDISVELATKSTKSVGCLICSVREESVSVDLGAGLCFMLCRKF